MLTRVLMQVPNQFQFELCVPDRYQWDMKNSKRTSSHKSSLQSYRYFTWIITYIAVYISKLNDSISPWDFTDEKVYLWAECLKNFSSKECVCSRDIKLQKSYSYTTKDDKVFHYVWGRLYHSFESNFISSLISQRFIS
jgi:hypothetical protein